MSDDDRDNPEFYPLINQEERLRRQRLPFGRHGGAAMLRVIPKLYIFVMMDAYFAADQGDVLEGALRIFDKQMKDAVKLIYTKQWRVR